ncbi:MAG: hypothetical protein M3Z66_24620 [Chloroflexota bacterium]|nr:hypothetical protein [Chloroflexota bacterium]
MKRLVAIIVGIVLLSIPAGVTHAARASNRIGVSCLPIKSGPITARCYPPGQKQAAERLVASNLVDPIRIVRHVAHIRLKQLVVLTAESAADAKPVSYALFYVFGAVPVDGSGFLLPSAISPTYVVVSEFVGPAPLIHARSPLGRGVGPLTLFRLSPDDAARAWTFDGPLPGRKLTLRIVSNSSEEATQTIAAKIMRQSTASVPPTAVPSLAFATHSGFQSTVVGRDWSRGKLLVVTVQEPRTEQRVALRPTRSGEFMVGINNVDFCGGFTVEVRDQSGHQATLNSQQRACPPQLTEPTPTLTVLAGTLLMPPTRR